MVCTLTKDDLFLSAFNRLEKQADAPAWLRRLRKAAIARFEELGFPNTRQEEWRFTDVAPLEEIPFEPVSPQSPVTAWPELQQAVLPAPDTSHITFVDGRYCPDLSSTTALPGGVTLLSLADVLRRHGEWVEPYLGRHAAYRDHAFIALNTALLEDGAFVHVARNTVIEEPIHLWHVSTAPSRPRLATLRNLIVAESCAQAKIVEHYVGLAGAAYFTNAVTEVILHENARIDHCKLQRETDSAFHFATLEVHQHRDSSFAAHLVSLGGGLVRHETNVVLGAPGCDCELDGLFMAHGSQHVDTRTRIDHKQPHCNSRETYKGILDDRAEGVFNGKIFVHPDAQKTDARQTNQTLLLSDEATVNTKPQLEIFADDVKCTHGATVGQLDSEALFYLRSRGIPYQDARSLLIYAFANDLVRRIPVEHVREELEKLLLERPGLRAAAAIEETA